jgi:UDP-N-acetylmuramate dehydrogenase
MLLRENVPLAPFTTLQVGGPARYFVEATTLTEVSEAVAFARTKSVPLFVLGGGSNLVISDEGWPGLVVKIAMLGINHAHQRGSVLFEVAAGEDWDGFVAYAVKHNCAGIECMSGIPGSVGGTPVQNVGAYGQEVSDTIASVLVLDLRDNQIHDLCKDACGFEYRTSIFNTAERGRYIILRVNYTLVHGGAPHVEYADLKRHFAGKTSPTLAETREAVLQIRASKAMLNQPGDPDSRSAGSFFKNPVVSLDEYEELNRRAAERNLQIPSYPALDERRKISAAWLVENSGFHKGNSKGPVGISSKHALAIINRGGATAREVLQFKEEIQKKVEATWGLSLQTEPVFVGF